MKMSRTGFIPLVLIFFRFIYFIEFVQLAECFREVEQVGEGTYTLMMWLLNQWFMNVGVGEGDSRQAFEGPMRRVAAAALLFEGNLLFQMVQNAFGHIGSSKMKLSAVP
ncbi:hypothetical protein QQ045_007083 [Rhodiola kirilowii]